MNKREKAAATILAARASNPPVYCWVEPPGVDGDNRTEAEQIADMQKEYPLRQIVSVSWRRVTRHH